MARVTRIIAAVSACGLAFASPASADTGYNMTEVWSPGGTVRGLCTYVEDVPDQSFEYLTILVKYEVVANAPAWATSGICRIRDANNKVYGSVVAGAPGSYATNAGTVVVPRNIVGAKACNTPEALWLDGTEANPANRTECTPL